jgi:tRNA 2-thiocytidine biosynthesis protein TtcA
MRDVQLPKHINRKIGRALHDYAMLSDGDKVLVAVSGGVDSLVNAWVLQMWRAKAPIAYDLEAVYVDNGFREPEGERPGTASAIGEQLKRFSIPLTVVDAWPDRDGDERGCYTCSRNRRSQLFDLARRKGCGKLALGHHKNDLIETFLINILYSGNVSTMVPRQDLFNGNLSLIRVLAYIEKKDIVEIAERVGLRPVKNLCPFSGDTRRDSIRAILEKIDEEIPDVNSSLFAALGNVRSDYLLSARPDRSRSADSDND